MMRTEGTPLPQGDGLGLRGGSSAIIGPLKRDNLRGLTVFERIFYGGASGATRSVRSWR